MVAASLLVALLAATPARAAHRPPAPATPPAAPAAAAETEAAASHRAGDWPAPSGKRVTLSDEVDLDEALQRIADAAGWSLVARTGRVGGHAVVVHLRDVPVEEALDAVLDGTSLVATRRGQTVTVAPGAAPAQPPVLSGFGAPSGKRFTGDFADVPVDQALRKVADAAGLSVVFPPGVRGAVNGHFRDAPVEDVLRVLLAQAGLAGAREGSILTLRHAAGASVVVEGGKRKVEVQVGPLPHVTVEGDDEPEATSDRDGTDRTLHGDQVIGPGERARAIVVLGGSARLSPGASARQVTAIGGSVVLDPGAAVDREVVAIGGDVHVAPGARVGGDAVSVGGKVVIDAGGDVGGDQKSVTIPGLGALLAGVVGGATKVHESLAWKVASVVGEFAVFFLLGLLVLLIVPRRLEVVGAALRQAPGKTVATGIVGALAILPLCILLAVTIVGIPFIAVVVLGLAAAVILGFTALALFVGRALPFRFERAAAVLQLAIGTAILVILRQIPILGWLAWIAAALFLLGVILRTRFGRPNGAAPAPAPLETTPPPPPSPAAP